jgi:hypothetical protein
MGYVLANERQYTEFWTDGLEFQNGLYLYISGDNAEVKVEERIG